ncbi:G-type lectin S-receptor-like serine/threonine-protein kinase LECRK3 [Cornus florida]|uniref:G-type lectin S-receptor-like serine/threonine-protein kinase LECRK3 n=1 Tax=Cornus florida TaxID=4283 RepID=UPI00289732B7|nr:G-type lectin S-receptor-like serine/threonine-protein kinase LECRK3 [Cornus florida]
MVIAIFFFLLLSTLHTPSAQQTHSNISLGSSLTPTSTKSSSWLSRSGLYAFGFYKEADGYAVGIFLAGGFPEKMSSTVVWTANRDDPRRVVPSNTTLLFSGDGQLLLRPTQGQDMYIATLDQPASNASMLDSGNFVLYNSDQQIIWQSFEHPTDTLLPSQRLSNGAELFSSASDTDHSKGIFRLAMQTDGHLVQYPVDTPNTFPYSYWGSGTMGAGSNVTLNLDDDGYLYLLNSSSVLKNLTTGGYPKKGMMYLMRIDVDGIFRLYSHSLDQKGNWSVPWESSKDKCDPKGLCGLNGFCTTMDEVADCRCLPGFDFVDPGKWSSGCERNFTAPSCKDNEANVEYEMTPLRSTSWEHNSYSVFSSVPTAEDCKKACLEDCNCEAALYSGTECKKQRLPMRYGRRLLTGDSTLAFIKVGTSKHIINGVPVDKHKETKKDLRLDILIVGILLVALAFVVLVISGILIYRNRVWAYKMISEKGNVEFGEDVGPRAFTYAELEQVTNGFEEELGSGSFGKVYKGALLSGQKMVAVKRLEKVLEEGEREFRTEMKVIGKTHHRNLVRLLGYCHDGPNRLLVYEYMSNGSLADILFAPENRPSWDERIRLALDIARGILYLHEECETQIIHCDIKPQNILMDEHGHAKISDFGLAKLLKPDQTRTFTGIRGTRGYVAPEWHRKLPVTVKADVFSFGIVLLEIICCRRSVNWSLSDDEAVLEEWVYDCFEAGEMSKLLCDEQVDKRKLERMVKVGLWCIQDEPSLRPSMKKVLLMLEGTVDIPVPPNPTSFLSTM